MAARNSRGKTPADAATIAARPHTIGYARAVQIDPQCRAQIAALRSAGVVAADIHVDGRLRRGDARSGWRACRDHLRPGDLLMIDGIDKLGRDVTEILRTAVDLCHHRIDIVDLSTGTDSRTPTGVAVIDTLVTLEALDRCRRAGGVVVTGNEPNALKPRRGRPPTISDAQVREALARIGAGETGETVARDYGVSRQAIHRRAMNLGSETDRAAEPQAEPKKDEKA